MLAASISNRKRGPTRNIGLAKKKQAGEKLPIIVSPGTGRVVGDGAQQFITEATCVLRRYATWQVKKWADIEETEREKLQKMIEVRIFLNILFLDSTFVVRFHGAVQLYRIIKFSIILLLL